MVLKNYTLGQIFHMLILPSLAVTVKMVLISGLLASILGTLLGVALVVTAKDGLSPHPVINRVLDIIVNVIRSFPFIILLISIIPFTRLIAGTSIGWEAAIVPLTVACTRSEMVTSIVLTVDVKNRTCRSRRAAINVPRALPTRVTAVSAT